METHLSSPYQNSAHVPMWTGSWINQKCTIRSCLQVSESYEEKIIIHVFCVSTENNQSNGVTMLAVFRAHFIKLVKSLHDLNVSSSSPGVINWCLRWRSSTNPTSLSMLYLKFEFFFFNLVYCIKKKTGWGRNYITNSRFLNQVRKRHWRDGG